MVTAQVFAEYELTKSFDRALDTLVPAMPEPESTGVIVRSFQEYDDPNLLPRLGLGRPAQGFLSPPDRVRDPRGDGSCGYHSIVDQLNIAKQWKPDLVNEVNGGNWDMIRLRAFVAAKFKERAARLMRTPESREIIVNNYADRRNRWIRGLERYARGRNSTQSLTKGVKDEITRIQELQNTAPDRADQLYIDDFFNEVQGYPNDSGQWIGRWMEELELNIISEEFGVIIESYDSTAHYVHTQDFRFNENQMFQEASLNTTFYPAEDTKDTDDYKENKMTVFKLLSSLSMAGERSAAYAQEGDMVNPAGAHWYWAAPQRPAGLPRSDSNDAGPSSSGGANPGWRPGCTYPGKQPAASSDRAGPASSKSVTNNSPKPDSAPAADQRQPSQGYSAAAAAALRRAGLNPDRLAPAPAQRPRKRPCPCPRLRAPPPDPTRPADPAPLRPPLGFNLVLTCLRGEAFPLPQPLLPANPFPQPLPLAKPLPQPLSDALPLAKPLPQPLSEALPLAKPLPQPLETVTKQVHSQWQLTLGSGRVLRLQIRRRRCCLI